MTTLPAEQPSARQLLWQAAALLGLCFAVVLALATVYAVAPVPDGDAGVGEVIVVGTIGLVVYLALTMWAAIRLANAKRPVLEGGILVTVMATVIILGYSWVYLGLWANEPGSFSEPLSKFSAVYFTVTVLATVGFGDITATTDTTRMVVTSQMILGLTLITVGIRLILQSTRQAALTKRRLRQPSD